MHRSLKVASPQGEPLIRKAHAGGDPRPTRAAASAGEVPAFLQYSAFAPSARLSDAARGCGAKEG